MNPLAIPKLTKHVNDYSDIFSSEQIESLSKLFAEHENKTTEQVVTVFIPHREGNELLDIGLKVFNENGIGQKNLNNGLLLIVATEEKKLRIVVGKGLELKYTEMTCREIIEKDLRPLLNKGDYNGLINKWINASTHAINEREESYNTIENTVITQSKNQFLKETILRKIIGYGIFLCFVSLFFGIIFGNEVNRFVYVSLIFGIPFLLGGIFAKFTGKETLPQKILLKFIFIILGSLFLSGAYFQTYCHTKYLEYIPRHENICKVFPIIMKDGGNTSDNSSHNSSSSHSSFGGGGGSSNGGGYGD